MELKTCRTCGAPKPKQKFRSYERASGRYYRPHCRACEDKKHYNKKLMFNSKAVNCIKCSALFIPPQSNPVKCKHCRKEDGEMYYFVDNQKYYINSCKKAKY